MDILDDMGVSKLPAKVFFSFWSLKLLYLIDIQCIDILQMTILYIPQKKVSKNDLEQHKYMNTTL